MLDDYVLWNGSKLVFTNRHGRGTCGSPDHDSPNAEFEGLDAFQKERPVQLGFYEFTRRQLLLATKKQSVAAHIDSFA